MNKVVINNCYGGFGLSEKAVQRYQELSGKVVPFIGDDTDEDMGFWDVSEIPRHDPALVQTVEELGQNANGESASLLVEEIPGKRYLIEEYDGAEELHYPEAEYSWIVIED